jgi:hypothetical protein
MMGNLVTTALCLCLVSFSSLAVFAKALGKEKNGGEREPKGFTVMFYVSQSRLGHGHGHHASRVHVLTLLLGHSGK